MAEQKKSEALSASTSNMNDTTNLDLGPGVPKQTVSYIKLATTSHLQIKLTGQVLFHFGRFFFILYKI